MKLHRKSLISLFSVPRRHSTSFQTINEKVIPLVNSLYPNSLHFFPDVITEDEEKDILLSLDKALARRKYEGDHWDHVISKYREIEITKQIMSPVLYTVSNRIKDLIMNVTQRKEQFLPLHLIDLSSDGSIGAHVDNIKFSGDFIASLSLNSTRILRLSPSKYEKEYYQSVSEQALFVDSPEDNKKDSFELYAPSRSLYMIIGPMRYDFTHAILGKDQTPWKLKESVPVSRRLSIIFRNAHPNDISN